MAIYKLGEDEVVLFKENCFADEIEIDGEIQEKDGLILLTNYNLVFTYKDEQGVKNSAVYSVNSIKTYNNVPQIKLAPHHPEKVEIYLTTCELTITFENKKIAKTFVHDVTKLLKGSVSFDETLSRIKKGLGDVKRVIETIDDTLEIDSVGMVTAAVTAQPSKPSNSKGAAVLDFIQTGIKVISANAKPKKQSNEQLPPAESALPSGASTETPNDTPAE